MLVEMNVLVVEDIDLIIFTRTEHINSCIIIFELIVTPSSRSFIKQSVMLDKSISILVRFHMAMPVEHIKLSPNDYMFESVSECPVVLFAAVIDFSFHAVLVRNDFEQAIELSRKLQIDSIMNLEIDDCYYLNDFEEA